MPTAAKDLVVVSEIRTFLQIKGTADDELLQALITAASTMFETLCNRSFKSIADTGLYDGSGGFRQFLPSYPIISVASVDVDGISVPFAGTSTTATGYRLGTNSIIRNGQKFPVGIGNVKVTYTAGYATIPEDLARACIHMVAFMYRGGSRVGESSKSVGGGTTSYSIKDMPDEVRLIISNYMRHYSV